MLGGQEEEGLVYGIDQTEQDGGYSRAGNRSEDLLQKPVEDFSFRSKTVSKEAGRKGLHYDRMTESIN